MHVKLAELVHLLKVAIPIVIAALLFGFLTDTPKYEVLKQEETEFKLVIRHSGLLLGECRVLSKEEIANTPPNMRRPTECPRQKAPLKVELKIDDQLYFEQTVVPSGIHDDGVVAMFEKMKIDGGQHQFQLEVKHQMNDGEQSDMLTRSLEVDPGRIVIAEYTDSGFRLYQPHDD